MARTVVLVDATSFVATHDAVSRFDPALSAFSALPLLVTSGDAAAASAIRDVPGVVGIDTIDDWKFSLLGGLNRVVLMANGIAADWTVGGVNAGEEYPAVQGETVSGAVATPAVCAAVNLSLEEEHGALRPSDPNDSLNHVTRFLSTLTVPVVAAGNGHTPGAPYETLSPWAEPEWVLAVGAATDEQGRHEARYSGRSVGAERQGPDVLAFEQSARDPTQKGTSWAAARVSRLVALARAWLFQAGANIDLKAGVPTGVPLVGVAVIDRDFIDAPRPYNPPLPMPALPVLATQASATDLELLTSIRQLLDAPSSARVLIQQAAAETRSSPDTSAPGISTAALYEFLDRLTARDLVTALTKQPSREAAGAEQPLFGKGLAQLLDDLLKATMPLWEWEIPTSRHRHRHQVASTYEEGTNR